MFGQYIERLYHQLFVALRLESTSFIRDIDFEKPWWVIITQFKWQIVMVLILRAIFETVSTLMPLFIAWAVSTGEFSNYLFNLFLLLGVMIVQGVLMEFIYTRVSGSVMNSVTASCNRFFLSVDPTFHTTRSSGQIISKVNRGASSYEPLLDTWVYDFWRIIIGLVAVSIALGAVSLTLGIVALSFMLAIFVLGVFTNIAVIKQVAKFRIEAEDTMKATTVENLQEVLLIRSTFATDIQVKKAYDKSEDVAKHQINAWMLQTLTFQVSWVVYIISLGVVGHIIFDLLGQGEIESVTAVALLATFLDGAGRLLWVGGRVGRFIEKLNDVQDMFIFIRNFGVQSFPVIDEPISK